MVKVLSTFEMLDILKQVTGGDAKSGDFEARLVALTDEIASYLAQAGGVNISKPDYTNADEGGAASQVFRRRGETPHEAFDWYDRHEPVGSLAYWNAHRKAGGLAAGETR